MLNAGRFSVFQPQKLENVNETFKCLVNGCRDNDGDVDGNGNGNGLSAE